MIHRQAKVKKLIRKQLTTGLTGREAALLHTARMLFDDDELVEMEMQVLRQLAEESPALVADGKGLDAGNIIRTAKHRRIRRLFAVGLRGAAILAAVLLVGVLSHHFHAKRAAREVSALEPWIGVADQIPPSEFACTVYWGDSSSISVHRASKGRLGRMGDIELWKNGDGELELVPLSERGPVWLPDIRVETEGQQQCVVKLPDGVRIRLDAGSSLSYPLGNLWQANTRVVLDGQALVDAGERPGRPETFVIETANGEFSTRDGVFTVLANREDTRGVLLRGTVMGDFPVEQGQRGLNSAGEMVNFDRCCYDEDGNVSMVLSDVQRADMRKVLAWTTKTRTYRDVPLREFVAAELDRWNSMETGSLVCIPESFKITATVSYRTPVDEIYAYIRQAGVVFYEGDGMISFCGPEVDPGHRQAPGESQPPAEHGDLLERLHGNGLLAYHAPKGCISCGKIR